MRKAALFDLDDTIFDHRHSRRHALQALAKARSPWVETHGYDEQSLRDAARHRISPARDRKSNIRRGLFQMSFSEHLMKGSIIDALHHYPASGIKRRKRDPGDQTPCPEVRCRFCLAGVMAANSCHSLHFQIKVKSMKATATVTSKGQLTLPKAVRAALDIQAGDTLEFEVHPGHAEIRPGRVWGSSAGVLKHLLPKGWKAPTAAQMNQGIARAVSERNARSPR